MCSKGASCARNFVHMGPERRNSRRARVSRGLPERACIRSRGHDSLRPCDQALSGQLQARAQRRDVEIQAGEFVFLVGASGSGKSSFLRLVLKEERPPRARSTCSASGSARSRPARCRTSGAASAWSSRTSACCRSTVYQNVAFTLQVIGKSRGFIQKAVPDVLEMVGLAAKSERLPHELSGGEQQRVAIARAVVNKPPILLADEPTGNLDPRTSQGIMQVLERINAQRHDRRDGHPRRRHRRPDEAPRHRAHRRRHHPRRARRRLHHLARPPRRHGRGGPNGDGVDPFRVHGDRPRPVLRDSGGLRRSARPAVHRARRACAGPGPSAARCLPRHPARVRALRLGRRAGRCARTNGSL